jgi:hypothetical protein
LADKIQLLSPSTCPNRYKFVIICGACQNKRAQLSGY